MSDHFTTLRSKGLKVPWKCLIETGRSIANGIEKRKDFNLHTKMFSIIFLFLRSKFMRTFSVVQEIFKILCSVLGAGRCTAWKLLFFLAWKQFDIGKFLCYLKRKNMQAISGSNITFYCRCRTWLHWRIT